jgi:hypothetical protein
MTVNGDKTKKTKLTDNELAKRSAKLLDDYSRDGECICFRADYRKDSNRWALDRDISKAHWLNTIPSIPDVPLVRLSAASHTRYDKQGLNTASRITRVKRITCLPV